MKKILILITVFLTSCVNTNTIGEIENKKFGVLFSIPNRINLCHQHVGFTVFQNFSKKYLIKEDINKLATTGYIKGIEDSGNLAVRIENETNFSELMKFSTWNAIPILTDSGVLEINKLYNQYGIDYLLVPWGFRKDLDDKICIGISVNTGNTNLAHFIPVYAALIFDAKTGKFVGNTQISNAEFESSFIPPADINNINENEISAYAKYTEQAAHKAIKVFFAGGWKHL